MKTSQWRKRLTVPPQVVVESPLIRSSTRDFNSGAPPQSLGELSPLSAHCCALAACFSEFAQDGGSHFPMALKGAKKAQWNTAADYLTIAGAVESVVVDSKCLRSEGMFGRINCKPGQLLNPAGGIVKTLAVFAFIWNALESTVAFLKTRPSVTSTEAGCRFLKDVYGQDAPISGYDVTLQHFQTKLLGLRANSSVNQVLNQSLSVSATGLGLYLVGNLRPHLLPMTRESSEAVQTSVEVRNSEIVELSSRLTLLSLQHLLLAVMKVDSRTVQDEDESMYSLEVDKLLRSIHLRPQRVDVSPTPIELAESV